MPQPTRLRKATPPDYKSLAWFEAHAKDLERWSGNRDCSGCTGRPECRQEWRAPWGDTYPWCPWWRRRQRDWQAVVQTFNELQVAPRADWPDGLAAYVSNGVVALTNALNEREAEKMKEATR